MQRMGQEVDSRVAPRDDLAVHPDEAVALIIWLRSRRH